MDKLRGRLPVRTFVRIFVLMEWMNLFSKITFRRAFNAMKVYGSYQWARFNKKGSLAGMPISIAIEPTTSCNLRCPECPSGLRRFTRKTGMLDDTFFRKTMDELYKDIFYVTFYFQGEPYLNPTFLNMVQYASSKKIYTTTSTNAHYLDDAQAKATVTSGLDRLIISIDGTTQESYSSYRIGGELNKVIEGTKSIIKWKKELKSKTPYVIFQFVVFRQNEHEVEEVKKLGKKLGVNEVKIKSAQIYDYENGNERIPVNQKYSRYEKEDSSFIIRNSSLKNCWRMWHSCVITWDGLVVPCCFDKDAQHQMGDLKQSSFRDIWYNNAYRSFRQSLLRSRREVDICSNCSEGAKVWV